MPNSRFYNVLYGDVSRPYRNENAIFPKPWKMFQMGPSVFPFPNSFPNSNLVVDGMHDRLGNTSLKLELYIFERLSHMVLSMRTTF